MTQNEITQYDTVYNEIDESWNYICNISNIRTFKKKYDSETKKSKLEIIYNNGSDVTITNINTDYFMKFLSCIARYKQQKRECDFIMMTQDNVYLLTDIDYKK